MRMIGVLLTLAGAALVAIGYFYLELSLWLIIPGGILVLIGMSLLNGAQELTLSQVRHRVSDDLELKGGGEPGNKVS
jgi:hypothetical protein